MNRLLQKVLFLILVVIFKQNAFASEDKDTILVYQNLENNIGIYIFDTMLFDTSLFIVDYNKHFIKPKKLGLFNVPFIDNERKDTITYNVILMPTPKIIYPDFSKGEFGQCLPAGGLIIYQEKQDLFSILYFEIEMYRDNILIAKVPFYKNEFTPTIKYLWSIAKNEDKIIFKNIKLSGKDGTSREYKDDIIRIFHCEKQ